MSKTKCLIVSPISLGSIGGGGASNSLLTFLNNQNFLDVDIILPLFVGRLFKLPQIIKQAYKLKPASVNNIYFLPLPWSSCFEGRQTSFKANFAYLVNNIIAFLFLPLTSLLINKSEYTFIYFNSIVLHQLVKKNSNHVLHIREIIDKNYPRLKNVINDLNKADGLIFIDTSSFQAYKQNDPTHIPCHRLINNPFDMHEARNLRSNKDSIAQELNLKNIPEKIFTYLGNLHPVKGTDLIIKAFVKANMEDAVLLIVGDGNVKFINYCRSLAKPIKNKIFFLGKFEYRDIQKIYAVSDFVLRGDPDFRIGRTTYEALYAGSSVILPGTDKNLASEKDLQQFASRIFFYEPQNIHSLKNILLSSYNERTSQIGEEIPSNNIEQNCKEMKDFFQDCHII